LTPIRCLDGITYWVIEAPKDIGDFIGSVLRKEWEEDLKTDHREPSNSEWLSDLLGRHWRLRIVDTADVRPETDYVHSAQLRRRRAEMRESIERYGMVLWPIVVRKEGCVLVDGYCRYSTLKEMRVPRVYAYVGSPT